MDIDPVEVQIQDHLKNVGDTYPVAGELSFATYTLGERTFYVPRPISYHLVLTNTGEGILATGILRGEVEGRCDRCLEKARFALSAEIEEYYRFSETCAKASASDAVEPRQESKAYEEDFEVVSRDKGVIDLTGALSAAIYAATPFVLLCRDDCKGICPRCGTNLNEDTCACATDLDDATDKNPFAQLKSLRDTLKEQE